MCKNGHVELAARQFLRAIRGRRSQVSFSRRLGYRSNIALRWEAGRRFPTAVIALRACQRVGLDVQGGLQRFHTASAAHLHKISDDNLARWLEAQRGTRSVRAIAEQSGLSRFQVSRCLSGATKPSLPVFFALVDALSGRLAELLSYWVDMQEIPALLERYQADAAARECAYAHPWSSAVLAQIDAGRNVLHKGTHGSDEPFHSASTLAQEIATVLNVPSPIVSDSLHALQRAGVIRVQEDRVTIVGPLLTDTRRDPEGARQLRKHWALVSAARLSAPQADDLFSHNVFAVSREDYAKLVVMQTRFYQDARAVIRESQPSEVAALMVLHLMAW